MDTLLIAGGGIGGLASALALARKGIASTVLERSKVLGEIGAGIQLGPNAFHAFDVLGIGEAARKIAVFIDKLRLMDATTGEEITHISLEDAFRRRFGNPYAVVHRGELHQALLAACIESPLVDLRTDAEVERYAVRDDGVEVALAGGATVRGRGLVGADGLRSRVRDQLIGDGVPRVSGHTTYRSVIPIDRMPEDVRWNAATLWAGPKCHIVHYPLSDWKSFNLVVTCQNDAREAVAGVPVSLEEVLQGFGGVHQRARQIIERGIDWRRWVLCDREPVAKWYDGPVVLLGDAAHPMLQYFAQGACMAIEDAVCLADEVDSSSHDVAAALQSYCEKRVSRTTRVQLQSRLIGDHIYHPSGAHARLRNGMMGSMSSEDYYDSLEWLYGRNGRVDLSACA